MAIITVKSDDASITRTGAWSGVGTDTNMFSTNRYYLQCTGNATPTGTYKLKINGLTPGLDYLLAFTLDGLANRQADQPIKIYDSDGTTLLDAMVINGQVPFDDLTYTTGAAAGTPKWTWVGKYTPSGTSLTLYTDNSGSDATKFAIVDAVYCQLTTDAYTPVYAPKRSGNWSSSSTWKMGAAPPPNVPILLKPQSPSVLTVDSSRAQGTSGATGTAAITIGVGCSLVVADGVTFQVLGDVVLDQPGSARIVGYYPLQIGTGTSGGGAIFEFNASAATTPLSQKYVVKPTGTAQANACVKSVGTSGNHAVIRSNAGGGNGWFSAGGQIQQNGQHNLAYTDVIRIGDGTNPAMVPQLTSGGNAFSVDNCRFSDCGKVDITYSNSSAYYSITNSTFTSPAASVSLACVGQGSNAGLIDNCRFAGVVNFYPPTGITVTNCHFGAAFSMTAPYTYVLWQYNAVQDSAAGMSYIGPATAGETYWIGDAISGTNPHPYITPSNVNVVATGQIFDMPFGTVGDMIGGGPGASNTVTVTRCLLLPNSAGNSSGEIVSPISVGLSWTVDHNTACSTAAQSGNAETGVAVYGETWAGASAMYASLRSNIAWSPTGKGSFLLRHVLSTISNPVANSGGNLLADYNAANAPVTTTGSGVNAVYGQIGGYVDTVGGTPTNPMFTSTTGLGVHDVLAEPAFVDPTRNWATFDSAYLGNNPSAWATGVSYSVGDIVKTSSSSMYNNASINYRCVLAHTSASGNATNGQPGVAANYQTSWEFATNYRMRTSNAVYNASIRQATPRDVWTWVNAGFAPTNVTLRNAGHDGVTIGAVEWTAAASFNAAYISRQSAIGIGVY